MISVFIIVINREAMIVSSAVFFLILSIEAATATPSHQDANQGMMIYAKDITTEPILDIEVKSDSNVFDLVSAIIQHPSFGRHVIPTDLLISVSGRTLSDYSVFLSDIGLCAESHIEFRPKFAINNINISVFHEVMSAGYERLRETKFNANIPEIYIGSTSHFFRETTDDDVY